MTRTPISSPPASARAPSRCCGGAGDGSFGSRADYDANNVPGPADVATGDFDRDGDPDLAVANNTFETRDENVSVLRNVVGGFGIRFAIDGGFTGANGPRALAVGDFNGDGDPDLAVANDGVFVGDGVSVLVGQPGGDSFGPPTRYDTALGPTDVAIGDFNGDGDPDIAVANRFADSVSVLLGGAGSSFGAPTDFAVGNKPEALAVGDFNDDDDPDIAVANAASADVSLLRGGAGGGFTQAGTVTVSAEPYGLAAGDVDGDADPDLLVTSRGADTVSLLFGKPGVSFGGRVNFAVGNGPRDVEIVDLNDDALPDLAVANRGSGSVSVLLQTTDHDGDGVANDADNCPRTPNADQRDVDADGLGDVCDPDRDGDGHPNVDDNCPRVPNPGQFDTDGDGKGDLCDPDTALDSDGDGVTDVEDNCPSAANPGQQDSDGDGQGDTCDPDIDNDGIANGEDDCPGTADPGQQDADGDGTGDLCDPDRDGDGITNDQDNCPSTVNPGQADADADGEGDACDSLTSDITSPTVMLTTPAGDAGYLLGHSVLADYACQDEPGGSGLASCQGPVADGAAIDTQTVGSKSFTVDAQDNAGNQSSVTHTYRVIYDFGGFYAPIDNPPTYNSKKAGPAIAIRFSLGGDQGLAVLAAGSPRSSRIDCTTSGDLGDSEATVGAGSGLVYDASSGRYKYLWKTDKQWAGTCRRLDVELADGTHHRANFEFR